LELEDLGFSMYIQRTNGEASWSADYGNRLIVFQKKTDNLEVKWHEIKDVILRLKDYLGNRYVGVRCNSNYNGKHSYESFSYGEEKDINEKTKIKGTIDYLHVEYRNFKF